MHRRRVARPSTPGQQPRGPRTRWCRLPVAAGDHPSHQRGGRGADRRRRTGWAHDEPRHALAPDVGRALGREVFRRPGVERRPQRGRRGRGRGPSSRPGARRGVRRGGRRLLAGRPRLAGHGAGHLPARRGPDVRVRCAGGAPDHRGRGALRRGGPGAGLLRPGQRDVPGARPGRRSGGRAEAGRPGGAGRHPAGGAPRPVGGRGARARPRPGRRRRGRAAALRTRATT